MSNDFVKGWEKDKDTSRSDLFKDLIDRTPMRERVTSTVYKLNMVQKRLEDSATRMRAKDKSLFTKCVQAQEVKDEAASKMYANEIAQLRKMAQTVVGSQMALEHVSLRLETVRDFGDVATEILPAAKIVRSIKNRVSGILPEVSYTLGNIGETLDGLVFEVGQVTGTHYHSIATSEDAEQILAEAAAVAEQKMRDSFPALPSSGISERGFNPP